MMMITTTTSHSSFIRFLFFCPSLSLSIYIHTMYITTFSLCLCLCLSYAQGQLFNINHNLLCSLGVSHPTLDVIVAEANRAGFPSKLTGAGGGGCALILSPVPYNRNDTNDCAATADNDGDSDDIGDREKMLQLQALIDRIK